MSVRVPPLGPLLGPSWGPLGPCGGPLGGLLGHLGAILGASWAVLDALETKQVNMLKKYALLKEWDDVCLLL